MEIDKYLINGLVNSLLAKGIITKNDLKDEIKLIKVKERKQFEKVSFKRLFTEEEKKAIKELLEQEIKWGPFNWASAMFHDLELKPLYKYFETRGGEDDLEKLYDLLDDHKRISEEFHNTPYTEKPIIKEVKRKIRCLVKSIN